MEMVESFLTQHPCFKAGKKITVKGLMIHSVGCPQPSAEVFVNKWNNAGASRACVHAFIDGNTGKVYKTLPWDYRAWHCGSDTNGSGNNTHIGVEMCEPACIKYTGGASFSCKDQQKALEIVKRTYEAAVELFAFLCGEFLLDPLENGVIISHKEGHDMKIASGHGDPDHLWKGVPCGYTMNGFRQDVKAAMAGDGIEGQSGASKSAEIKQEEARATKSSDTRAAVTVGAVVGLTDDATYYDGKEMPEWVKKDRWIVTSVSGDRVVLGKNASGTNDIKSPVNEKHLK